MDLSMNLQYHHHGHCPGHRGPRWRDGYGRGMRGLIDRAKIGNGVLTGSIDNRELGVLRQRGLCQRAMRKQAWSDGSLTRCERRNLRCYRRQTSALVDRFRGCF